MSKKREYTAEFKIEAVGLVKDQGYKVAEAARSLGVHPSVLGRWVREYRENNEAAFPGKGNLSPEQEELRSLRKEVKELRMEKEILKKATAFFAKESS